MRTLKGTPGLMVGVQGKIKLEGRCLQGQGSDPTEE